MVILNQQMLLQRESAVKAFLIYYRSSFICGAKRSLPCARFGSPPLLSFWECYRRREYYTREPGLRSSVSEPGTTRLRSLRGTEKPDRRLFIGLGRVIQERTGTPTSLARSIPSWDAAPCNR